jgi:oligosaccharide 4-alpha-D-glucosyltransferase
MKNFFLLLLLVSTISFAQNANRKFENYKNSNNTLTVNTSDGQYLIKAYSEKIVETSFIPKGDPSGRESAKQTFSPESHAVVLVPKKGISKVKENATQITFSTKGIVVSIQKSPFKI